jgi:putative transposase
MDDYMDGYQSLNHTKWGCKYHVAFITKRRRRTLYVQLRQYLGEVFRRLAEQKECRIEEGHLRPDHVHIMIATPPLATRIAALSGSHRKAPGFGGG